VSGDDGDPSDRPPREEKRAKDLLAAGAAAVDPAMAARLRAFFGEAPAPRKPRWQPPPGWEAPPDASDRQERRQRALAAVDPGLVAAVSDRGASYGRTATPPAPPAPVLDLDLPRFDLGAWGLTFAGEAREVERPDDLRDALAEATPQALLRDLHRPVLTFRIAIHPVRLADPGVAAERVRDAIQGDYQVHMAELRLASAVAATDGADRRRVIWRSAWADAKPAVPSPVPKQLPDANDFRWFGDVGVDPDL